MSEEQYRVSGGSSGISELRPYCSQWPQVIASKL